MTNKKHYIIVAEDDTSYAIAYEQKLMNEGFEVKVVNNGEEALQAFRERKPDLALMDIMMPIMDGFEVLEAVKNDKSLHGFPIIMTSNLGQEEDIQKALGLGAKAHLVKANTSIVDLVDKIKSFIK